MSPVWQFVPRRQPKAAFQTRPFDSMIALEAALVREEAA